MEIYIMPIKTAFLTFPILAFLFTLPFLIYQFRKYKYVNKIRGLVLYSFLLYLLVSFYLVILPLPTTRDTCSIMSEGIQYFQLKPFNFISQIGSRSHLVAWNFSSYINLIKENVFLQVAFNGILLLPLGIYLRYYFKKNILETVATVFLVSLFFEITQITGLYTIYNCPYRIFDVDDIILNTAGGLLGYIITPIVTFFLPKSNELDKNVNLAQKKVGYIRRLIALGIDWLIIVLIITFIPLKKDYVLFAYIAVVIIYFVLMVYLTKGKTLGKSFIKIKVEGENNKLTLIGLFIRYSLLYYGFLGLNYFMIKSIFSTNNEIVQVVLTIILFLFDMSFIVHALLRAAEEDNRLFYEKLSKTRNVIQLD